MKDQPFQVKCIICDALSPEFEYSIDLANWLVEYEWYLEPIDPITHLTFCKECHNLRLAKETK